MRQFKRYEKGHYFIFNDLSGHVKRSIALPDEAPAGIHLSD